MLWDSQVAPLMGLASGRGSLADRFHASVQSSFLVGGGVSPDTHQTSLASFCSEVVGAVGDMGVEFSLPCVLPVAIGDLFPWMPGVETEAPASEFEDWSFNPASGPVRVCVSYARAMQVAGVQHIVHNAASDMLDACPVISQEITKLTAVVKMCIRKFSRKRLLALCYASDLGKVMARTISFRQEVYPKRWRTMACGIEDLMKAKASLQWGWDKAAYVDREKKVPAFVEVVDSAMHNDRFWFTMDALDSLFFVIAELSDWARACPCHGPLITPSMSKSIKRRWLRCPLRGLRLPELCSGDLLAFARDVMKLQAVSLAVGAPDGLNVEERDAVIFEYHRAQSHLLSTMALKLGPMQHGHFQLAAAAHHNADVARDALQRCLLCDSPHPLMQEFREEPVRQEAAEYVNGWRTWEELVALPSFLGQFKFCPVDETVVEGMHGSLERKVNNIRNRTVAYDSMVVRLPYLRRCMQRYPDLQNSMVNMLEEMDSPLRLADCLGVAEHPSAPVGVRSSTVRTS